MVHSFSPKLCVLEHCILVSIKGVLLREEPAFVSNMGTLLNTFAVVVLRQSIM